MSDFFKHHATGIAGSSGGILLRLEKVIPIKGNPDFIHEKFETLTIDDSRRIRDIHESRPFSPDVPRVFVIELFGATREAQNALLKTLEEPRPDNYFFIVVPTLNILLPTVRSRLYIDSELGGQTENAGTDINSAALKFLTLPLGKKIAFVDELAANISDDKAAKHEALTFLNSVERGLYEAEPKKNFSIKERTAFAAIARARDYLNDRAPSVKMLLEYVALSVPAR